MITIVLRRAIWTLTYAPAFTWVLLWVPSPVAATVWTALGCIGSRMTFRLAFRVCAGLDAVGL